jgi:hypothetical protein
MEGAAAGTVEVLGMAALGDGTVTAGAAAGEGESLSACRQSTSPRPSTIRLRTILRHIMRRTATLTLVTEPRTLRALL